MFGLYNSVERVCNPNKPVFYCDLHRILETSHLNTPDFIHEDLIINPWEKNENVEKPSRNVERKMNGAVPLSRSARKVNGVSFGSRPILHPNVGKICAVAILLTNQPTDWHWQNHNIYGWGESCLQTLRLIMYCIQWNSEFMNKYWSFQPGVKMFTTYCKIYAQCVCAQVASSFHITLELVLFCLLIGFQTSCDVTNAGGPHVKLRFKLSLEKL